MADFESIAARIRAPESRIASRKFVFLTFFFGTLIAIRVGSSNKRRHKGK
jgi:hypothetical protein